MQYYSIPEIANKIDISDNTVRRYIKRFGSYFSDSKINKGIKKYSSLHINIIRDINNWYSEFGYNRDIIRGNLEKKFGDTGDISATIPDSEGTDISAVICYFADRLDSIESKLDSLISSRAVDAIPDTLDAIQPELSETVNSCLGSIPTDETLPDCHGNELSVEERDSLVLKTLRMIPGRGKYQQRADVLNRAGILTSTGKGWSCSSVRTYADHAKGRLKARQYG